MARGQETMLLAHGKCPSGRKSRRAAGSYRFDAQIFFLVELTNFPGVKGHSFQRGKVTVDRRGRCTVLFELEENTEHVGITHPSPRTIGHGLRTDNAGASIEFRLHASTTVRRAEFGKIEHRRVELRIRSDDFAGRAVDRIEHGGEKVTRHVPAVSWDK